MAGRRFTLAGLLLSITLAGLILAFVVPLWRYRQRARGLADRVTAIAMSADGSTAAALTGDGTLRAWDLAGSTGQTTLATGGGLGKQLALSHDGKLAALPSLSLSENRDEIEIWDISSRTRKPTAPTAFGSQLFFSPTENILVTEDAGALILHSLHDGAERGRPIARAGPAAFSPDGRAIAVGRRDGIHIYETTKLELPKQLLASDLSAECLAFSPDGKSLAAIEGGLGFGPSRLIEVWNIENQTSRQAQDEPSRGGSSQITYLPGGRAIAVPGSFGLAILDATTLEPLRRYEGSAELAAGARGGGFVVADRSSVDLYDAQTLQKVKRLLDANPKPSPILPLAGLWIWLLVFFKRRWRRQARACAICGQRVLPAGKDGLDTECPTCREDARLTTLSTEQAAGEQRIQSQRNWRNLLLLDVLVAAGVAMGVRDRFGLLPVFLSMVVAVPVLGFLAARLLRKWVVCLPPNLAAEIAVAERAAGSPGRQRNVGEVFVWSAEGTSLADELEPQLEAARQRLATVTGRLVSPSPRLRVFIFSDGDGVVRYLKALGFRLEDSAARRGFLISAPASLMFVGERDARLAECERCSTLRWFIARHLIEQAGVPVSCAWLVDGLSSLIAYEHSEHERATLNRRALAAIAARRTIPAAEWLAAKPTGRRRRHGHSDLHDYAWLRRCQTQSWSLMEFLCGCGATPERRAAFQQFFHDGDLQKHPAEAFERHFGCSLDGLFAQWRAWVEEQGMGEHRPPPPAVAEYLTQGPLAQITAAGTTRRARVEAIREWSERGYTIGAEQVIGLLRGDDEELRAEAVYALECASGLSLGLSPEAWEAWCERVRGQRVGRQVS